MKFQENKYNFFSLFAIYLPNFIFRFKTAKTIPTYFSRKNFVILGAGIKIWFIEPHIPTEIL